MPGVLPDRQSECQKEAGETVRKNVGTGDRRKNKSRILFLSPKFRISLTKKSERGPKPVRLCEVDKNYLNRTDCRCWPGDESFILWARIPSERARRRRPPTTRGRWAIKY